MDNSAASAYVYAKAGGILARSFVGQNASRLFSVKSLRDLHSLLFSGEVPSVPEMMLSKIIEEKAEEQFISQFVSLIENYSHPAEILVALLRFYDYDNLKEIGAALCFGESARPHITDIGSFSMLNYDAWPNLKAITENSPVSWYSEAPKISEQQSADSRLDGQYIRSLWSTVEKIPESESGVAKLIRADISARNILWVLRLKVYYKMAPEEIREKLAFADDSARRGDVLAGEALSIIDKDVGSFDDWKDWKYRRHLNPHEDGTVWEIDPTWVEKSFRRELGAMAMRSFHKEPMSVLSMVAWFKIKQNELDNIRTVAEGLRLNIEEELMLDVAGMAGGKKSK